MKTHFIHELLKDEKFAIAISSIKEAIMPYINAYIKKIENYEKSYQIVNDDSLYSNSNKGTWLYFKITTQKDEKSNYQTRNFGKYDISNNQYIRRVKEYDLSKYLIP